MVKNSFDNTIIGRKLFKSFEIYLFKILQKLFNT